MKKKNLLVSMILVLIIAIFASLLIVFKLSKKSAKNIINYNEMYEFINSITDMQNLTLIDTDEISIYLPLDKQKLEEYVFAVDLNNPSEYFFVTKNLENDEITSLKTYIKFRKEKDSELYKNIILVNTNNYTYIVSLGNDTSTAKSIIENYIKSES